jgi:DNA-binding LytR/AlgR family response regulator
MEQEKGLTKTGANFLVDGRIIRLDFSEITHIGVVAGVTNIYTRSRKYVSDYGITDLLQRLPGDRFLKIHRDFVVAPAHVDRVEQYQVFIGRYRLVVNFFYRSKLLAALDAVEPKPLVRVAGCKKRSSLVS